AEEEIVSGTANRGELDNSSVSIPLVGSMRSDHERRSLGTNGSAEVYGVSRNPVRFPSWEEDYLDGNSPLLRHEVKCCVSRLHWLIFSQARVTDVVTSNVINVNFKRIWHNLTPLTGSVGNGGSRQSQISLPVSMAMT